MRRKAWLIGMVFLLAGVFLLIGAARREDARMIKLLLTDTRAYIWTEDCPPWPQERLYPVSRPDLITIYRLCAEMEPEELIDQYRHGPPTRTWRTKRSPLVFIFDRDVQYMIRLVDEPGTQLVLSKLRKPEEGAHEIEWEYYARIPEEQFDELFTLVSEYWAEEQVRVDYLYRSSPAPGRYP